MIFFQKKHKDYVLALATVHPEESFYLEKMEFSVTEQQELEGITHRKTRMEWLAVRYLLHQISGVENRFFLEKDAFGKPHLACAPNFAFQHCSISHSKNIVAALVSTMVCGCDVQVLTPKIERIAPKFLSEKEKAYLEQPSSKRLTKLNTIWSAKESLYKAYGRKALEFKQHITVSLEPNNVAYGIVEKADFFQSYELFVHEFQDENSDSYIFTWCLENK